MGTQPHLSIVASQLLGGLFVMVNAFGPNLHWRHSNRNVLSRRTHMIHKRSTSALLKISDQYERQRLLHLGAQSKVLPEPSRNEATFGRQSHWDEMYRACDTNKTNEDESPQTFSWYSTWDEIKPFWSEIIPNKNHSVLIPGVGNDPTVARAYDDGWRHLTAFDYSNEGVALARAILTEKRLEPNGEARVLVDDARILNHFGNETFDAVFEKGTLDAVFLAGGSDLRRRREYLRMAVEGFGRVLRPGGVVLSLSTPATNEIYEVFESMRKGNDNETVWEIVRDSRDVYITDDGYASNNVDATILVWGKTHKI